AGIGQQPAVWTVAERTPNERCADPVVMVQLQPEEHDNVSSGDQRKTCLKRFLHVADFAGAHNVVAAQGKSNGGTEHGRKLRERSAQKEDEPCDHSMMGGSNDGSGAHTNIYTESTHSFTAFEGKEDG
ncbi:unnamed protein product, partial [Sphacelaria rigidula]